MTEHSPQIPASEEKATTTRFHYGLNWIGSHADKAKCHSRSISHYQTHQDDFVLYMNLKWWPTYIWHIRGWWRQWLWWRWWCWLFSVLCVCGQAKRLLVHALNEFNQITNDRPNRAATLGFIMTVLEAKWVEMNSDRLNHAYLSWHCWYNLLKCYIHRCW